MTVQAINEEQVWKLSTEGERSDTGDCVSISTFFCTQVFLATELIRKICVLWLSMHVHN